MKEVGKLLKVFTMSEFLEKEKYLGVCSYDNCSESQYCVRLPPLTFVHDFLVRLGVRFEMSKIFVTFLKKLISLILK